ncbi:uncharacterized protein BX663DRAFT_516621, partial [Cokeromyces recurvatus]|uniref:uncharacterized protein n=1 Tax=Cokeromyces recurvatus TaxID=90255 RepID=UPI0022210A9C
MFSNSKYSRVAQFDDEDEGYEGESALQHPNSVLVSNHHGHCNVVPLLSQTLQLTTPHHSPPNSSRPSLTTATNVTRRFFETKLPIVFRKDMNSSAASFSSLPAVIVADLQNGDIPIGVDKTTIISEQGWAIIDRRRFKGKNGIGESRHPFKQTNVIDEEIDPSDQVTCSVFVKWQPSEERHEYTMITSPLFNKKETNDMDQNERVKSIKKKIN